MRKANIRIDPNKVKTRDHNMVRIIQGVTKGGTHVDRRKHANKYAARGKVRDGEEA